MKLSFLDKWAIKRANKIATTLKEEEKLYEKDKENTISLKDKIKTAIQEKVNVYAANLEREIQYLPIKEGDIVILNKYSPITNDPSNLLYCCKQEEPENNDPFLAKITEIKVCYDRYENLLNTFLENLDVKKYINKNFENIFETWTQLDNCGLYLEAYFETQSHIFQPKWGVNVSSFVKLNSLKGQAICDLWKLEREISGSYKKIEKLKKKFEIDSNIFRQTNFK